MGQFVNKADDINKYECGLYIFCIFLPPVKCFFKLWLLFPMNNCLLEPQTEHCGVTFCCIQLMWLPHYSRRELYVK